MEEKDGQEKKVKIKKSERKTGRCEGYRRGKAMRDAREREEREKRRKRKEALMSRGEKGRRWRSRIDERKG